MKISISCRPNYMQEDRICSGHQFPPRPRSVLVERQRAGVQIAQSVQAPAEDRQQKLFPAPRRAWHVAIWRATPRSFDDLVPLGEHWARRSAVRTQALARHRGASNQKHRCQGQKQWPHPVCHLTSEGPVGTTELARRELNSALWLQIAC